ncbi:LPS export ABC transporter permease LptG [Coralliovum pocilloporae]|uniref:LPS export ABC transporter permease LptG n=1 Tax=Coralliovum pocilloporae TaxID=3066369 RepID=UPI00330769AE
MALRVLGFYFASQFVRNFLVVLALCFTLIFLVDFVEVIRRAGDKPNYSTWDAFLIAAFRAPTFLEQAFPFAALFSAIATLVSLNRRSELTVTRAAGISVWQFLLPIALSAGAIGLVLVALLNPVTTYLKAEADTRLVRLLTVGDNVTGALDSEAWLRQGGSAGDSILNAKASLNDGKLLYGVTIVEFDQNGLFSRRLDAQSAELKNGQWLLKDGKIIAADSAPVPFETELIATNLSETYLRERLSKPDTVSVWRLPTLIEFAEAAGLPADRYRQKLHSLIALPVLLISMVLVAATVSLKISRMGGLTKLILGGVSAGFVLYVISKIAGDLGATGLVPPGIAAWTPSIVAMLMSMTILLYTEDG